MFAMVTVGRAWQTLAGNRNIEEKSLIFLNNSYNKIIFKIIKNEIISQIPVLLSLKKYLYIVSCHKMKIAKNYFLLHFGHYLISAMLRHTAWFWSGESHCEYEAWLPA